MGPAAHIPVPYPLLYRFAYYMTIIYYTGPAAVLRNPYPIFFTVSVRLVYGYLLYGSCHCTCDSIGSSAYLYKREGHAASTNLMARCQILNVNKGNPVPHGIVPHGSVELVN